LGDRCPLYPHAAKCLVTGTYLAYIPELELSFFWRFFESVLGDAELFLVLLVQLDALLQPIDELGVWQFPQTLDRAAGDECAARGNELVGDLDEERSEPLRCVVVGRDTVDDAY